jgi:hypothetical protein
MIVTIIEELQTHQAPPDPYLLRPLKRLQIWLAYQLRKSRNDEILPELSIKVELRERGKQSSEKLRMLVDCGAS